MGIIFGTKQARAYSVLIIDCVLHILALIAAGFIRHGGDSLSGIFVNNRVYITILVLTELFYAMLYVAFEKDEQDIVLQGSFYALTSIMKRQLINILFLMVFLFVTKQSYDVSRIVLVAFCIIDIVFECIGRFFYKLVFRLYAKTGAGINRLLLVTIYDEAKRFLDESDATGLKNVIGIVILDRDVVGEDIEGVPVVGNKDSILDTGKEYVFDEVFLHLPYGYDISIEAIIFGFEQMGIPVNLNIDVFGLSAESKSINTYGSFHVITFQDRSRKFIPQLGKRLMDILGAIVGLLLTAIIFLIFAPIIKLSSKGPVFFSQTRVGMNGRQFRIYKFRTMVQDAEELKAALMSQNEMEGLMFKMENDPRVTKIGRFMRRTNLDEFPQFLNVLKGDMSLVGTRPPTLDEYSQYENYHLRRLSIKPGITGLWQVSGRNNVKNFEDVVKLDFSYIDHWSLLLDIKIMLQTIGQIFTGSPDPSTACCILGVNVSAVDMNSAINKLLHNYKRWSGRYVCAANVHTTVMSVDNPELMAAENGAVMTLPDGKPLSMVARKRGCTSIGRVAGPDVMTEIFKASDKYGLRHFFYGSTPLVLEALERNLKEKYPGIIIAGMISPPFGELTEEEDERYVNQINEANADFVWIGLGAPKQELYMASHKGRIKGLMMGVGAGFDFHAGTEKRAPLILQKMSLEWLYRLIHNPRRLLKRYTTTNIRFMRLVNKENRRRKG